jgi:hypothetical protein
MNTAFQRISAANNESFVDVVQEEIKKEKVPPGSNTYDFIARNDAWNEIAECARDEGFFDVADICDHACSEWESRGFGE